MTVDIENMSDEAYYNLLHTELDEAIKPERGYREFKKSRDLNDKAKASLTAVLIEKAVYEPVAIVMGGNKTLICVWNGENGYDFSLIRSFS